MMTMTHGRLPTIRDHADRHIAPLFSSGIYRSPPAAATDKGPTGIRLAPIHMKSIEAQAPLGNDLHATCPAITVGLTTSSIPPIDVTIDREIRTIIVPRSIYAAAGSDISESLEHVPLITASERHDYVGAVAGGVSQLRVPE